MCRELTSYTDRRHQSVKGQHTTSSLNASPVETRVTKAYNTDANTTTSLSNSSLTTNSGTSTTTTTTQRHRDKETTREVWVSRHVTIRGRIKISNTERPVSVL